MPMNGAVGSHTWSDTRSFGSKVMFNSVAPLGAGSYNGGGLVVCGGLVLHLLTVEWYLAGHWIGSGAGVVVS